MMVAAPRVESRRSKPSAPLRRAWNGCAGAQIVEFAVSLPLLVVFVVGIFDFSNAVSLKQKLTNAAREAARVAASDPANDLGTATVPASVWDANKVVDKYLTSEKINDCGLSGATPTNTTGLTWDSTSSGNGCPGTGIDLQVNRGCPTTVALPTGTIHMIGTCITLSYAYSWQFNRVIGLVGGNANGANSLTANAQAFNEN
jgi:Flp pilus assembly protein TadG